MDAELLVLIWNRISGYTGRFFHVDGDEIVETGDWVKEEQRRYSLEQAEKSLALDLFCQRVIREMDLQPIQDQLERIDLYIAQLGPVGTAMLAEHKEFMDGEKGETETGDRGWLGEQKVRDTERRAADPHNTNARRRK